MRHDLRAAPRSRGRPDPRALPASCPRRRAAPAPPEARAQKGGGLMAMAAKVLRQRARARGDAARQAAVAVRLLLAAELRPIDLVDELGCSYRTVLRVLKGIAAAGWKVDVDRRGRDAWYRLRA